MAASTSGVVLSPSAASSFLYGIGEFGDAVKADDGQRAIGLVHAGARLLQVVAGRIAAWAARLSPARSSARSISPLTQDSGPMSRSMLIESCSRRRGSCIFDHTLKPETEPFSSTASSVSSPIDTAVSCVLVGRLAGNAQNVLHRVRPPWWRCRPAPACRWRSLQSAAQGPATRWRFRSAPGRRHPTAWRLPPRPASNSMAATASWVSV
jgi:hypothetical protein